MDDDMRIAGPPARAAGSSATDRTVIDDADPPCDEVRRARAWLSRAIEPGPSVIHDFLADVGPVEAAARIRAGQAPSGVLARVGARAGEDRVDADLAEAHRRGIRLVTPEDEEWPAGPLLAMELACAQGARDTAPPLALWARGPVPVRDAVQRAVAVVGARAATAYGEHVAADLGYDLARRGWTVVSGGAYGIDGAAHRGALAGSGVTVAVMAGGLDVPYPAGHSALFERIAATGLLISEWPVGCTPQRHRFLVRNRLVAGFAAGSVVVEAGARSGAQSTARLTGLLGRPLMAVPGPVTSAMSVGAHVLIRDAEARLVTTAAEVVEEVGSIGADLAPRPHGVADSTDRLDHVAARVLDAVPLRVSASPERVAVDAGLPVGEVLRCLPALELLDLVVSTPDGWTLSRSGRRVRRR